ncbi:MAG: hypothetical protein HOG08_00375 [Candidatus Magasanikbacteria bacterium]|nr:hypothetical protein [Candidatus Magasanikbacteria bacterium]
MDALSQEEILEEIIYKPQGYYDNIFKILNKLVGLKEAKAEFDRQGRIMKRVNEIISGGLNNKKFKYLRGADPASVVSLALSIKLLHQKGIKDIKFSLMMPLREHGISESLDRDILSRKINIIERCCVELGGLKLLYDESYITLKLPEELAIRTEKLQQLFTMIDNNQEV